METELPYGPWVKIFSAQWKDYPLQILENPEKCLLTLLFEKKDNSVTGILALLRRPYALEGDLSKLMLPQKRDLTVVEKRTKSETRQYLLLDATPGFVNYEQEALEAEVVKQYEELESAGKVLKAALESGGQVKLKDAKRAGEEGMQPLLGDPVALLALLQGRAVAVTTETDAQAPLGMDLHNQVVTVPFTKMRTSSVVGGTREKRRHVLHLLMENALLNHTPVLLFDDDDAFAGLTTPNRDAQGLERFPQDRPVGFSVKEYRLGKGLFIDLSLIETPLFLTAFALEKANVAPLIEKAFEGARGRISSVDELAGEVLKTPETRETPRFLIQRAARVLRVIHKGYAALFAKNLSEELVTPWKEEIGKVLRIVLAGQREDIQLLATHALLKSVAKSSPSGFTLYLAFGKNASELGPYTLNLVRDLARQGLGFAVHDENENNFPELGAISLQVEIVGNDAIVGVEGESQKRRVVLRPAYSQCNEFTVNPHA